MEERSELDAALMMHLNAAAEIAFTFSKLEREKSESPPPLHAMSANGNDACVLALVNFPPDKLEALHRLIAECSNKE